MLRRADRTVSYGRPGVWNVLNGHVFPLRHESDFGKLVKDLIYLEHDAIAAYESTIERLDDKTLSAKVDEFRQDHLQHLSTLNEIAAEADIDAPTDGDMK